MLLLIVCAMFVNWIATTILVEGKIFEPLRDWVGGTTRRPLRAPEHRRPKLAYLVGCHLCTGTWVGLVTALFVAGPFTLAVGFAPAAIVLNGLLYKAGGHAILHVSNLTERLARG